MSKDTYSPNVGSKAVSKDKEISLTVKEIKDLNVEETIRIVQSLKSCTDFSTIQESIMDFYEIHGSLSDNQLDTLKSFILIHSNRGENKINPESQNEIDN